MTMRSTLTFLLVSLGACGSRTKGPAPLLDKPRAEPRERQAPVREGHERGAHRHRGTRGQNPQDLLASEVRQTLVSARSSCASANLAQQRYACLSQFLCTTSFAPSTTERVYQWPLPETLSGSTASGLVPLGPSFEFSIDAVGKVGTCGVSDAVATCIGAAEEKP